MFVDDHLVGCVSVTPQEMQSEIPHRTTVRPFHLHSMAVVSGENLALTQHDRLLPIGASRRIAADAPNLVSFVEMACGHCAILEQPDEVNRELRALAESVQEKRRISS